MIKRILTIATLSLTMLSVSIPTYAQAKTKYIHTFQNVAIYYHNSKESYLIDEDGEIFNIDFPIKNNSVILVTYDNKNTVTRLDDEPIAYEILKKK